MGVVSDVDLTRLEQARWAVVINALEDAALLKALWPLIEHRMRQMGLTPPAVTFREGESAGAWYNRHTDGGKKTLKESWGQIPPVLLYRPGERTNQWLARAPHGVANTTVDPRRGVPFYLMLLGRPGALSEDDETFIPLVFQYELDIFWGVGRVCFTDEQGQHRLSDYTTYTERLIEHEQRRDAAERVRREIVYFATRHEADRSTFYSADELVLPLHRWSTNPSSTALSQGYSSSLYIGPSATRARFESILTGDDVGSAPALLFTAAHGLGMPLSDERLVMHQGALVMGDWNGSGPLRREHWFAGEDLVALSARRVGGMFAILSGTYSAGCPAEDEFIVQQGQRARIAPFALIAQLPQQLLVNGAVGILGYAERAWTYSFQGTAGIQSQPQPFEDMLGSLTRGYCVGHATDQLNAIQGLRSMSLIEELSQIDYGRDYDPAKLARLWMARNDSRNYTLLGDPAARIQHLTGLNGSPRALG